MSDFPACLRTLKFYCTNGLANFLPRQPPKYGSSSLSREAQGKDSLGNGWQRHWRPPQVQKKQMFLSLLQMKQMFGGKHRPDKHLAVEEMAEFRRPQFKTFASVDGPPSLSPKSWCFSLVINTPLQLSHCAVGPVQSASAGSAGEMQLKTVFAGTEDRGSLNESTGISKPMKEDVVVPRGVAQPFRPVCAGRVLPGLPGRKPQWPWGTGFPKCDRRGKGASRH